MTSMTPRAPSSGGLALLAPPYTELRPYAPLRSRTHSDLHGSAIVWHAGFGKPATDWKAAHYRPGGVALIAILPRAKVLERRPEILEAVLDSNPQSVLPYTETPTPETLRAALRRPPAQLSLALTDYLRWRGIRLDRETRRLVQRTVELSPELRTVTALARGVYLSRRALGRRFFTRGLPVPSHWLHFSRVLHAAIAIQNRDDNVFSVAVEYGYPDGFSLSNQMHRLTGVRPVSVRRCLGWEWLVECWLRMEQASGALRVPLAPAHPAASPARSERLPGTTSTEWPSPSSARYVADSGDTSPPTASAPAAERKR